ncbi:hypothetical protein GN956_G14259 [Arapaima gigas]
MTNGAEDARYSYFCRSPGWYECRDPNLMLKAMGNYPVIYSAARCNWSCIVKFSQVGPPAEEESVSE